VTGTCLIFWLFPTISDLPSAVLRAATHISLKALDLGIVSGRSPMSVAAASIYMASQASESIHKRTQKQIAEFAGIDDVKIRQSYKLLLCKASELFPSDFKFDIPIGLLPLD
jgi:transcription initiation factor TFIIB